MTLLVAYSVRDALLTFPPYGVPHTLLAVAVTALLHLWRGNMLLSIGAGTALFMGLQRSGLFG